MQLRPVKRPALRLNLTPLIDVVFLLLVFFMLTSTFSKYTGLELSKGRTGAVTTKLENIIIVRVGEKGRIHVNGLPLAFDKLAQELVRLAGNRKLKIVLKPNEKTSLQDVVDIIERIRIDQVQDILLIR